jgi:hypothetical protein
MDQYRITLRHLASRRTRRFTAQGWSSYDAAQAALAAVGAGWVIARILMPEADWA